MASIALAAHQSTYDAVFSHPISHNLQWRDVHAMLIAVADVSEDHNGRFKFTRSGQSLTLKVPQNKDILDADTVMRIRQFLTKSESSDSAPATSGQNLLVVIDHREALIFSTDLEGATPQRILPDSPDGEHRYLHDVDKKANGHRDSEFKSFYAAVIKAISGAHQVLIFGSSTGASSAMTHLLAELKLNHSDIARRVIGSQSVDASHMTEPQLLAKARDFYAHNVSKLKPQAGPRADSNHT